MHDAHLSPYACPYCEALALPAAADALSRGRLELRCPVCDGYARLLVSEDAQGRVLGAIWVKEEHTYGLDG